MATKEFESSKEILNFTNHIRREDQATWQPPDAGWIKCNIDGASRKDGSTTGCGGIIRNSKGEWTTSFLLNLGRSNSLSAEI